MSIGFWDKLTHVLKPLSGVTNLFNRTKAGLTPQAPSGNDTSHYLREDGEWVEPPNSKVTQTISSSNNANYRVLLSETADDVTRTEGTRKDADLTYNPSTNTLNVSNVNGTASIANHANVATRVCRDDNAGAQMVFHWDGAYSGNHAYLWGSTDAVNNWVYHTTQMHVAGASVLDTLAFSIRYGTTITSSAAAGAEICACTLGYTSGKFLVFFSPRWSSVNTWYHLTDLATNSRICDVVGGSNASGFGVGFVDANSDRWFRVTSDANLSNATIAIFVAVLRLS